MDIKPRIGTFMQYCPYRTTPNKPLIQIKAMMAELNIRHLPVVDDSGIVGILSDRDIKNLPFLGGREGEKESFLVASDLCTTSAYIVDENEALEDVLETMIHRSIGSALVTRDGTLVGIFTSTDSSRILMNSLKTRRQHLESTEECVGP